MDKKKFQYPASRAGKNRIKIKNIYIGLKSVCCIIFTVFKQDKNPSSCRIRAMTYWWLSKLCVWKLCEYPTKPKLDSATGGGTEINHNQTHLVLNSCSLSFPKPRKAELKSCQQLGEVMLTPEGSPGGKFGHQSRAARSQLCPKSEHNVNSNKDSWSLNPSWPQEPKGERSPNLGFGLPVVPFF